jgi:metal-sulfur cluster biosynthetic enzyme
MAQGTPLSLPAMGLVRGWHLGAEGDLVVEVAVTAPGCTFVGGFADAAARAVAQLPGVAEVVVRLDAGLLWSERLLRPDAAAVLGAARSRARDHLDTTRDRPRQETA